MIPTNVHSYSRTFAQAHGVTGAIVLKHIAYKVRHSTRSRDGKLWHYNSAKKLVSKLPYLSSSTISAVVKKLEKEGVLEIEKTGKYNRRKADRTHWYHVTDEVQAEVEMDLIRYDSEVAKGHGVLPAVLHYNLCYFLKEKRARPGVTPTHEMSPALLSQHLNWKESAIKKSLAKLVRAGVIVKCPDARSTYTLPDDDIKLLRRSRLRT